jgi:hypothetical protein
MARLSPGLVLVVACGIGRLVEGFAAGSSPGLLLACLPQARAQSGLLALRCVLPCAEASAAATTTAVASRRQVRESGCSRDRTIVVAAHTDVLCRDAGSRPGALVTMMGTGAAQAGRGRGRESRRRRACRGAASPAAPQGLERTNRMQAGGRLCDGR